MKLLGMLFISAVAMFGQYGRPGYTPPVSMPEPTVISEIGVAAAALGFIAVGMRVRRGQK